MSNEVQQNSLAEWFRDWRRPLRQFIARRLAVGTSDIDDIAQEVFLRLLRYDRADVVDHPQAYLFKIASNVSAEWRIRASRRLPHDSEWLVELVDSLSPETKVEREEAGQQLQAAVLALPPRAREILRLHFGEGLPYPQVASTLGISKKMVYRDMERAYASLRVTVAQLRGTEWLNGQGSSHEFD